MHPSRLAVGSVGPVRTATGGGNRHAVAHVERSTVSAEHHPDRPDHASRLARLSATIRELNTAQDVDQVLQRAVDLAVRFVDIDVADIMLERDDEVITPVVSQPLARAIDQAQVAAGGGPCLSAMESRTTVVAEDLATDDRWPAFRARATRLGVRSVVAYPLYVHLPDGHPRRLGALNLYGFSPGPGPETIQLGELFAAHCATALHAEMNRTGLRVALERRDVIGQAKGILVGLHRITADDAYDRLRRASNDRNVKLHDLAQDVARIGRMPDRPG